jgi:hypothetical protein
MADKKITELTPTTGANLVDADEFVVVDVSADETKSVTRAEFFKNTPNITTNGTITSNGVYLGGVSGDNLLNDYEEGTWTPVITDGTNNATSSVAVGSYTKIGNHVHVQGRIAVSSLGSVSGVVSLRGLPFNSKATSNNFGVMSIGRAVGLSISAGYTVAGDLRANIDTVNLVLWDSDAGITNLTEAEFSATGDISFSMDYVSA